MTLNGQNVTVAEIKYVAGCVCVSVALADKIHCCRCCCCADGSQGCISLWSPFQNAAGSVTILYRGHSFSRLHCFSAMQTLRYWSINQSI